MKNNLFLLVLFLSAYQGFAQFSIESNFNSVHIGRNQNLLVKYQWNRLSVNGGIKYNFNKENHFPQAQGDFYKKAFWAINPKEHWGAEIGLHFNFLQRENIAVFGFYQLQVTKSHTRHDFYYMLFPLTPDYQSEYDFAYHRVLDYIGPFWAFENNLGIGIDASLSANLYFTSKLGGGVLFHRNLDKNTIIVGSGNWELSEMISMGLGWKLK